MYAADTIYVCNGTIQEFGVPISSGSTYSWEVDNSSVANIVSGSNSELVTIQINSADIFRLFVTETDLNGCIGADSIVVIAHSLPNPIIASDEVNICDGDSILIELNFDTSFNSYLWNNNDTELFTYATDAGSFFVTVTDTNGCSKTSNIIDVTNRIPEYVTHDLEKQDYQVVRSPLTFGIAAVHGIRIIDGKMDGGADPSHDGVALAI